MLAFTALLLSPSPLRFRSRSRWLKRGLLRFWRHTEQSLHDMRHLGRQSR